MAFMSVILMMIIFMPLVLIAFAVWVGAWVYIAFSLVLGVLLLWGWNRFGKSQIYLDALAAAGWQGVLATVVKWAMLIGGIFYLVSCALVLLGVGILSTLLSS